MTHARFRKDFLRRVVVQDCADDIKLLEGKKNQYLKFLTIFSIRLNLVNSRSAWKVFFVFYSCKFLEKKGKENSNFSHSRGDLVIWALKTVQNGRARIRGVFKADFKHQNSSIALLFVSFFAAEIIFPPFFLRDFLFAKQIKIDDSFCMLRKRKKMKKKIDEFKLNQISLIVLNFYECF